MSMNLNGFDANTIQAFDPIPAGWYLCAITASEEKPTKAQTGSYLELKIEVLEGDFQGRFVFDRLNLNNPNQTAVDIAQRSLSAICHATGVMMPKDSSDLHDKPLMVKIAVKPASGDYQASNEVKGYEAREGGAPATATASTGSTPPWLK